MGTVVSFDVSLRGIDRRAAVLGLAAARRTLHAADSIFSTYREHSSISRLRRGELDLLEMPPDVGAVLELCRHVRDLSEGWFDPWSLPGGVDPTGLVKGWAAERALADLVVAGVEVASVNAGGDITTVGEPSPGVPWRFGIQSPTKRDELIAVVNVTHAIATSGIYERGAHLFDPKGDRTAETAVLSASVVGDDLAVADGLATALAVAGPAFLARLEGIGYGGLVVATEGRRYATQGFPFADLEPRP